MRIALYQPDIAQNTGTILRLAACLSTPVDIIGPTGFDMSDRALRRAGLDYLDQVSITRHVSFEAFIAARATTRTATRLIALTTHASDSLYGFTFRDTDTLLFGRESAGLPDGVHQVADARLRIPLKTGLRSLNLAVATGIVVSEALRQTGGLPAQ